MLVKDSITDRWCEKIKFSYFLFLGFKIIFIAEIAQFKSIHYI